METLRRVLNTEVRVLDHAKGVVEYVASDETLDSYREIVRASGWRFTNFKKNAPFVDSHDYSTISKLVGKVIDFRVKGNRLVETVQWAKDENPLAELGWRLTEGGFAKAVSVGFYPVRAVTPNDQAEWRKQLRELGLEADAPVSRIFTEQEQVELSAVIIGANPNALATVVRARAAGIVSDAECEWLHRGARGDAPSRPVSISIPFPEVGTSRNPSPSSMNRTNARSEFLRDLDRCTSETKSALDKLTTIKNRRSSEDEFARAIAVAARALALEHRLAYGDPIKRILNDPAKRAFINAMLRKIGIPASRGRRDESTRLKLFGEDDNSLGTAAAVGETVVDELFDLLALNGAWARLGVVPTFGKSSKFPVMTALPAGLFIPTEGGALNDDAVTAGTSVTGDTALCGALLTISNEWMQDASVDISDQFLEAFEQALNERLDYAVFQGDGTDDSTNGKITGIIPAVTTAATTLYTAGAGETTVQAVTRGSLVGLISSVDGPAMQRGPRFFGHPNFVGPMLNISDDARRPVLKTALEEPSDEMFSLCGFPLTLSGGLPSTNAAATKVLVFGAGRAYGVGLRKEFELQAAPHTKFNLNCTVIRALIRAGGKMRRASGMAVLKTAAV